jgi:CheY-like chemotaxis protein
MVVDDDEVTGRLLLYQLQGFGYQAFHVQDGLQALQRVLIEQPDLILLDVMMPHVSGWDVCREIRSCSNVPIIMVTAKDSDDDVATGLAAGADDYIAKPFNMTQIQARIEAVLRRTSQQRVEEASTSAARANTLSAMAETSVTTPENMLIQSAKVVTSIPAPIAAPVTPNRVVTPVIRAVKASQAPAVQVVQATLEPVTQSVGHVETASSKTSASQVRLGMRFQNERQSRSLSLYQAERLCRIRWDFLQALEHENWSYLPQSQLQAALETYAALLRIDLSEYVIQPKRGISRQLYYQAAALMAVLTVVVLVVLMLNSGWL